MEDRVKKLRVRATYQQNGRRKSKTFRLVAASAYELQIKLAAIMQDRNAKLVSFALND